MKGLFLIFCVFILKSQAISLNRVTNGEVATTSNHACMVLIVRKELEGTETAALGSGSIVSRRHVLTAGHVVYGKNNRYILNFFVEKSRRSFQSTFSLIHESFDRESYDNDIGLIFLMGDDYFSAINVIRLSTVNALAGVSAGITGYGFTSKQTIGVASVEPISASQTVTNTCVFEKHNATASHFCALDPIYSSIICPGDNGAGLFVKNSTTGENELIGVASIILKGCAETGYTAYTRISQFSSWISVIANM